MISENKIKGEFKMSKTKKTANYTYEENTNWDGEKVVSCIKTVTKSYGNIDTVSTTKAYAICKVDDTFDLEFGQKLAKAKADGDFLLAKKLIDKKYPQFNIGDFIRFSQGNKDNCNAKILEVNECNYLVAMMGEYRKLGHCGDDCLLDGNGIKRTDLWYVSKNKKLATIECICPQSNQPKTESPKEESLLEQFKKGDLVVTVDTQEEKIELSEITGIRLYSRHLVFRHHRVDNDNDIVGYAKESFIVESKKTVTFAEFKASIEPPQPVGLVDKMGILDLMMKDNRVVLNVKTFEELRLAQSELQKKGAEIRIIERDFNGIIEGEFCFRFYDRLHDSCGSLNFYLKDCNLKIYTLENNEIIKFENKKVEKPIPTKNLYSFIEVVQKLKENKIRAVKRLGWEENEVIWYYDDFLWVGQKFLYSHRVVDILAKDWVILE
jgi:hypothetical protein